MQAQFQRAVFHTVPEGKFHLIAIAIHGGIGMNRLPPVFLFLFFQYRHKQRLSLLFFQCKLRLIRQRLIAASAALPKVGARTGRFVIGRLQYFQKPPLPPSVSHFLYDKQDALPRQPALYNADTAVFAMHRRLIGKLYFFYDSFRSLAFFHNTLAL